MINRPWAFWRRMQYGSGLLCILLVCAGAAYLKFGYKAPSCTDGIWNAEERGIDCGGSCQKICLADIVSPEVLWAESFQITEGQYNAVAYIENRNKSVGTPELRYQMKLYDDAGLIVERIGTTVLPPDSVYPIFEGKILTGDRIPTRTVFEYEEGSTWLTGTVGREQFEVKRRELVGVDQKPRLIAELYNTSRETAEDIEIVATIFDSRGTPLTTARTIVESLDGMKTSEVFFTWPFPIAKTLRSCEVPTDVMLAIDLSGSMNNDGDTPPEPITSVLTAAKAFVGRLKEQDQVGVVTYATHAELVTGLTPDSVGVGNSIPRLVIDPKEERGSTNIGEALKFMKDELASARHNEDARKIAIILTDGLATAPKDNPEVYAEGEAVALKDLDTKLFTIGLGKGANTEFLKSLASRPTDYYNAPTTRELESIYTSITESICEDGPTVIEIIPKARTSFEVPI